MRRMFLFAVLLGLGAGCFGLGKAQAADEKKDSTLNGTFVWSNQQGKTHNIKAVFTPNGDKKWTVVFTFDWKGEQVWKGTAEGDLVNGDLKGDATTPDGRRKFTFEGKAKDGKVEVNHKEGKNNTGTMTLNKG